MRGDGRRLDFNRVAAWAGPGYPVGCLEYVDFRTMASLATLDDNDHSINYVFMVIRGRILIREIGKKIAYTQQAHSPKFLIQY